MFLLPSPFSLLPCVLWKLPFSEVRTDKEHEMRTRNLKSRADGWVTEGDTDTGTAAIVAERVNISSKTHSPQPTVMSDRT